MFCSNCGKEIDDKAVICPGCGVPVAGAQQPSMNQQYSNGDAPFCSSWILLPTYRTHSLSGMEGTDTSQGKELR